jgi:hypothetical protein
MEVTPKILKQVGEKLKHQVTAKFNDPEVLTPKK